MTRTPTRVPLRTEAAAHDGAGDEEAGEVRKLREGERPQTNRHASRQAQGERLRESRIKAGHRTASKAASELKIAGPTYLAHENGTRQIRPDMAEFYAQHFGVTADYILYNRGSIEDRGRQEFINAASHLFEDPLVQEYARLTRQLNVKNVGGRIQKLSEKTGAVDIQKIPRNSNFIPVLDLAFDIDETQPSARLESSSGDTIQFVIKSIAPFETGMHSGRLFAIAVNRSDPLRPADMASDYVVVDADGHTKMMPGRILPALFMRGDNLFLYEIQVSVDGTAVCRDSNGGYEREVSEIGNLIGIVALHTSDTLLSFEEQPLARVPRRLPGHAAG